ncbi:hypothetical protein JHK84_027523 [Glycine max]|nr:hypothetical protein JHK84_027523 [Glycine max]
MANFPQMDSKGCVAVSICSLCYKDAEMSNHLLLHYDFSQQGPNNATAKRRTSFVKCVFFVSATVALKVSIPQQ